ncbi:MAG: DUF3822 family protein [Bacteroidota bacterium]
MNNQNSILLIDSTFEQSHSVNCSLLIKVGFDSLSYAIINKDTQKVAAVFDEQECEDGLKKLSERLKNDPYLAFAYRDIKISILTENNILVPNELYGNGNQATYASFFTPHQPANVYTALHPDFGFTSVFTVSELTDSLLNEHLVNCKKYEPGTSLLKLAADKAGTSLLLDFTAGTVTIVYIKEDRVIFRQCYEIANEEELNYYLLLIINQLNIATNSTSVYLSGIIDEASAKYQVLRQSFNAIDFLSIANTELNQEAVDDLPAHYYATLFALDQCV